MALITRSDAARTLDARLRRGLAGAAVGGVVAAELIPLVVSGPLAAVAILAAALLGTSTRSDALVPLVTVLFGGIVGMKAILLAEMFLPLSHADPFWVAMIGFLSGVAAVLGAQPATTNPGRY